MPEKPQQERLVSLARQQAIDNIYNSLDEMFRTGRFQDADNLLREANPTDLEDYEIITYLTVTALARDKLPYRSDFVKKSVEELKRRNVYSEELVRGID